MEESGFEARLPLLGALVAGRRREQFRVREVRGDSMTGVDLFDGEFAIFVEGRIRADGTHVISLDGDVLVKRLQWDRVDRQIARHSENNRCPESHDVPMEADVFPIERKVVGWFHRHPHLGRRPGGGGLPHRCTAPHLTAGLESGHPDH
jgi:SOS-response transcriptional repressor LexA